MDGILAGIASVPRAAALIVRERRLRRLALAPLLVNVLLVLAGLPMMIWLAFSLGDRLVPFAAGWPPLLRGAAAFVAALLVSVMGAVLLLVVGRILAAPVMTRLSEGVEEWVLGDRFVPRKTSLRDDVIDTLRGISFALGRLLIFILFYPLVLLTGLIPVAGAFIMPALTFLYGAFVLSLDFTEPSFERHLPGFWRRVRFVLRHFGRYAGFGGVAVLLALIPLANLAVLPVCVAAASLVFAEKELKG